MKKFFLLTSIQSMILANVLIFGDSAQECKCDDKIVSAISLQTCTKIEAINEINICYFKNNTLGCKKLFPGDAIDLNNTDTDTISFSRLLSFNNNSTQSFGIKRFSDNQLSIGLPSGTIRKPQEPIKIELEKKYSIKIGIYSNDKLIDKSSQYLDDKILIKTDKLKYGKNYTLLVQLDNQSYKSNFDILDKETDLQLQKELINAFNNIQEQKNKDLIQSILYDQYGLNFDRINTLTKGKIQ